MTNKRKAKLSTTDQQNNLKLKTINKDEQVTSYNDFSLVVNIYKAMRTVIPTLVAVTDELTAFIMLLSQAMEASNMYSAIES